jgi:hypothetical protein
MYWNLTKEEHKTREGELFAMRQKLLMFNMKDLLRVKLTAIGIDSLLRSDNGLQ